MLGQIVDASPIPGMVQSFGVLAALVWFMYYTVRFTIPSLNRSNNELVGKIVADHRETINDMTTRFDVNLKDERDARRIELVEERQLRKIEMNELAEAIRSIKHQ